MDYQQAYSFLIPKLENSLPSYLSYHHAGHTKSVIEAATYIAGKENITGDDLVLLQTAALFHDAGFLQDHTNHEELSCNMARKELPAFDYTPQQIELICRMIMATRLPQTPADNLGEILCDADLYYLGTDDYTATAKTLYKELKKQGSVKDNTDWVKKQEQFLSNHQYFTQTAVNERQENQKINLQQLKPGKRADHSSMKSFNGLEFLQDLFLIVLGVITAGFALKGFLVPNQFFDGGVTGISLLIHELYHLNLAFVIIIANLPLIVISFFSVGRSFAIKTFFCILLLGICLLYFPYPVPTTDKLLISVFGGVFLGIGIGLAMRAGCALDGVEVLALYTLKRTSFTISEIILGINILIFAIAAFQFGIETALYSILTYFAASRSIDYVVEGIQAYTGVTIISSHSELLKHKLVNELGRGITVYKGERGFLPGKFEIRADCDIIFTVITRLELRKLKNLVYEVDPKAFVFANTIKEASGGIIKRRHAH